MSNENDGALIVELRGEVIKFENFQLTFGDVMQAKHRAQRSASQGKEEMAHEVFWLVRKLFEKNGIDKDIEWIRDVPIYEMKHVLKKINERNPGFEQDS